MDKQTKTLTKRPRRTFTPEFKAEAVRLCKVADRSITRVAADLNLDSTALREWVHRADIDGCNSPTGELTTDERAELARLRRQNKQLLIERDILKKGGGRFNRLVRRRTRRTEPAPTQLHHTRSQ